MGGLKEGASHPLLCCVNKLRKKKTDTGTLRYTETMTSLINIVWFEMESALSADISHILLSVLERIVISYFLAQEVYVRFSVDRFSFTLNLP